MPSTRASSMAAWYVPSGLLLVLPRAADDFTGSFGGSSITCATSNPHAQNFDSTYMS